MRIDAFGLTARLEGRLTVSKAPDQAAIGNGRLVIMEGDYQAGIVYWILAFGTGGSFMSISEDWP